jgi:hypothetical protein
MDKGTAEQRKAWREQRKHNAAWRKEHPDWPNRPSDERLGPRTGQKKAIQK